MNNEFEITNKINKLNELKKSKNAVILAHYYTLPEVQNSADFLGDSLFLAQKAKEIQAEIIIFCGVNFMAETAKILNPTKKVLIPDNNSFCSLADSVDFAVFLNWKNSFENPYLISYINCSTEVKAISDVICTSANVLKIAESAPKNSTILFATDENLGNWVNKKLNLNMKLWKGNCVVHQNFSEENLNKKIKQFSKAKVVAHPECPENILKYADFIGSTTGILNFITKNFAEEKPENNIKNSIKNKFIILTETGISHQLKKMNKNSSDRNFIFVEGKNPNGNICFNMKNNTLDKMISALENQNLESEIEIDENLRIAALKPLEKMLTLSNI